MSALSIIMSKHPLSPHLCVLIQKGTCRHHFSHGLGSQVQFKHKPFRLMFLVILKPVMAGIHLKWGNAMSNGPCSFKAIYVVQHNAVWCEKKELEYFKTLRKLLALSIVLPGAKKLGYYLNSEKGRSANEETLGKYSMVYTCHSIFSYFICRNIEKWEQVLIKEGVIRKCNVRGHHCRTLSEAHRRHTSWMVVLEA